MPTLANALDLERCPHCSVSRPNLVAIYAVATKNSENEHHRFWRIYKCERCGGLVTAYSYDSAGQVLAMYPDGIQVAEEIEERPREYLRQALDSLSAPAGAVMLAASSVDAMLKDKGLVDGSLYSRINKAAEDHLITDEMAKWAHEIRLDANDQRHADTDSDLPDLEDAERCVEFARALGQFLYVLPDRVQRGIESAAGNTAE